MVSTEGLMLSSFPSGLSCVPLAWNYLGTVEGTTLPVKRDSNHYDRRVDYSQFELGAYRLQFAERSD